MNKIIRINTAESHSIYNQNTSTLYIITSNDMIVDKYRCSESNVIRLINDIESNKCINPTFYQ